MALARDDAAEIITFHARLTSATAYIASFDAFHAIMDLMNILRHAG